MPDAQSKDMGDSVSLREYFEAILHEREGRYQERFNSQANAINKAEEALGARLNLLNELRSGVATKEQLDAVGEKTSDLAERLNRMEGRSAGNSANIATFLTIGM